MEVKTDQIAVPSSQKQSQPAAAEDLLYPSNAYGPQSICELSALGDTPSLLRDRHGYPH